MRVTFLLSDVEGSTKRWEAEPAGMEQAMPRLYSLLDAAVSEHGGVRPVEQGEGDSIVAAFSRASDAVGAALSAQLAIAAEDWPSGLTLRVRIALHAGEAQLRDEGNYFGLAISRCARLRAIANGGQTVMSRAVRDLVADRVPDGVQLVDCGVHRLRDLGRPEHVFLLEHPSLPAERCPLRSLDPLPNNLPAQLSTFVGRARELDEVRSALGETRLLTLTGPGGSGKTRLALPAAADALERFPDGAWWVGPVTGQRSPADRRDGRVRDWSTFGDGLDSVWASREALSVEESTAWVRRARGERRRPPTGWESLTPTELRVVELAAAGLTNPQIAERMFVSRATVKTHLEHLYAKLGVPNRASLATAYAARQEVSA